MGESMRSQVIVVIGGTTGLGLSGAKACCAQGAKVVVVGRNPVSCAAAQEELGDAGLVIAGDASSPQTAVDAIQQAVVKFGGFHGLYHVAGGSGRRMGDGPLHDISDQGWEYTISLNLTSLMNSNRAAAAYFVEKNQSGCVLNMGSVLGYSPSPKFFASHAYAACKAGIIGLTRAAASYYASRDIRFNVIAPALVETPMSLRAQGDETIQKFIKTKQPLAGGRMGNADDLDAAVVFLLSDASRYVTGQVLAVDGGWTVSEGQIPEGA